MTVRELIEHLSQFSERLEVEIATSPHKDEWYEVADVERTINHRGNTVIVINTD